MRSRVKVRRAYSQRLSHELVTSLHLFYENVCVGVVVTTVNKAEPSYVEDHFMHGLVYINGMTCFTIQIQCTTTVIHLPLSELIMSLSCK